MKIKTKNARRVIAFALAVLTVIALTLSLSACGDSTEAFKEQAKHESNEAFVARIIASNESYKLRFLAGYNGYDISPKENEQALSDVDTDTVKPDYKKGVDAGKKVMELILENSAFANEADKTLFEEYKDSLTRGSMELVINNSAFKVNYELSHKNGFPAILLVWIGKFLGWLTGLVGDYYVLAIMLFAVLVEILMLPIAIKQQKNTVGMAKLRPQIAKIEKKYAGRTDPATLQKKREEVLALQQKEGYSPFSGCLPLLLQLIVVGFILYPIIQNPLRYVLDQSDGFSSALLYFATAPKATGGLGLQLSSQGNVIELLSHLDLGSMEKIKEFALIGNGAEIFDAFKGLPMPKFTAFGINLGEVPSFTSILILVPILNVAAQWITMFLTKRWNNTGYNAAMDGQSAASMKIMEFLPLLMTLWILFKIPSMIGVYWLFRSLISLLKQFLIKLAMPVPKFTEEELKELEKLEKERQKAQKAALKAQPKFKSLHYIDDDDYEELPNVKTNAPEKKSSANAPEIKD